MFQDLSWLRGLSIPAIICGTTIVLAAIELYSRFVLDDSMFTSIIRALRGPRQIIQTTVNTCPKCNKTKTITTIIDPSEGE